MTLLNRTLPVIAALVAATLVAGCGAGDVSGKPTETSSKAPGSLHGAPAVENPIDTTAFQKNPCSVLKPAQISALHMQGWKPEVRPDATGGPSCDWGYMGGPPDYTVSSTAVTFMVQGAGLKRVYEKKDAFEYFRELKPIEGYPAVAGSSLAAPSPEEARQCDVHVGVTNDLVVLAQVNLGKGSPYEGDPCGRARAVATEVVRTLKGSA